jgi:hypothetical protein
VIRKCTLAFAGLTLLAATALTSSAQAPEVKEKPRMYTYVSYWAIPRAQWADYEKANAQTLAIVQKALADGTLVAYGSDQTLIHQADGATHDGWFSAMALAGLLNVLDQIYKSGHPTAPAVAAATKHWDEVLVTRYYNWHSGSWKGVYTYGSSYKLKADAPDDAVDQLSKNLVAPLLEKMLADGTIHEYEIDTQAVHTSSPGTFWIFYIGANAESLDKVNDAIRAALKANPLAGPAFGSMVDSSDHRDALALTSATYK